MHMSIAMYIPSIMRFENFLCIRPVSSLLTVAAIINAGYLFVNLFFETAL